MPEDGEAGPVLRRPVEERRQLRLGPLCGKAQVTLLGKGRVHRRQRDLEDARRLVPLEVPGTIRTGDSRAEANCIREAERRVVAEAELRERCEVCVRIRPQVVVTVSGDLARE